MGKKRATMPTMSKRLEPEENLLETVTRDLSEWDWVGNRWEQSKEMPTETFGTYTKRAPSIEVKSAAARRRKQKSRTGRIGRAEWGRKEKCNPLWIADQTRG